MRLVIRLAIFLGFLVLIVFAQRFWFSHAWNGIGRITRLSLRRTLQIFWALALLVVVSSFLHPFVGRFLPLEGFARIFSIGRTWLIASVFGFLIFELVMGAGGLFHSVAGLFSHDHSGFRAERRTFLRYAAYLAGSIPFFGAAYGYAIERWDFQVDRVEIPIANWPRELDGMTIMQLSDIHRSDTMPRKEVARAVSMANALRADLAVITGDFISYEGDPLEDCIAELSKLRAPLGVWGCNGNHEIYAQAEAEAQRLFAQFGMRLLRQENAQLEWRGGKFNLIGVDYQRDHMTRGPAGPMLANIDQLIRHDMPNILLSHNPNSFRRAADLGIELSLAGHTHGGQVKFEVVDHDVTPARLITEFVAGLYRLPFGNGPAPVLANNNRSEKAACIYVNRGLGTFGMPVRLGVPPEITLMTLRSA
ncbi:MAG TPA: metallophosphoesterase [Terriglobales bacterium]|nr:metallophosphoesterase [Terriglobales bacterium]